MPYSIRTKDGIILRNIPDEIRPDDDRLKQLVLQRRQQIRFQSPEFQEKVRQQEAEDQERYSATSGMGGFDKVAANLGAGLTNFGLGLAQLVLPKTAERAFGITDESIQEKRARDAQLAGATTGGKLLQIAAEAAPGLAIPGGVIAKGLGALPKVGSALNAAGVGTRAIPTLLAEGSALGAAEGAITPTISNESVLANTVMGGLGGAAIPAALGGGKFLLRPFSRRLQESKVAEQLGEVVDIPSKAVAKAVTQSNARVVDAPQSLAAITQNPRIAALEMAARANPETAPSWAQFDELVGNARWKALADALGSEESVKAAKQATDAFANTAIPEVFKAVKRPELRKAVTDFGTAVQGRLNASVRSADPAGQEVYGYVKQALEQGDGSPQMLWNIRKTLSSWLEGTPPPGKEGTRGTKLDREIMAVRKAIDETLNRATGKKWSKFLERYGEYAQKEAAQKAGQNIRNAFFDEILQTTRGPTTSAGNPAVTRAKLEGALAKFGKNEFGEVLDWKQRNVIDQVLSDLRADEILQRAKSAMTSKGGSQTAPLLSLMKRGAQATGSWMADIAQAIGSFSERKQRQILNEVLQSPEDAIVILREAERLKRPLTQSEKYLVQAARGLITSPTLYLLSNQMRNQTGYAPQNGGA